MRRAAAARVNLIVQHDVRIVDDDDHDEYSAEEMKNEVRTQLIDTFNLSDYDAQMETLFKGRDGRYRMNVQQLCRT